MSRRGFTLIEVLIALALMTLLAGLMAEFGLGLADRREKLTHLSEQQHALTALFQQIDLALTGADIHGQGVQISETGIIITSRRIIARPSLEEFDAFTISFDADAERLTARWDSQSDQSSIPDIRFAGFQAFDGEQWGPLQTKGGVGRLPQAVKIAVWFMPNSSDQQESENTTQVPTLAPSRSPDRWRIFSLIDTLPEVNT